MQMEQKMQLEKGKTYYATRRDVLLEVQIKEVRTDEWGLNEYDIAIFRLGHSERARAEVWHENLINTLVQENNIHCNLVDAWRKIRKAHEREKADAERQMAYIDMQIAELTVQ